MKIMKFRIFFPTEIKNKMSNYFRNVEKRFQRVDIRIAKWIYKMLGGDDKILLDFKWKFLSDEEILIELSSKMKKEEVVDLIERVCFELSKRFGEKVDYVEE